MRSPGNERPSIGQNGVWRCSPTLRYPSCEICARTLQTLHTDEHRRGCLARDCGRLLMHAQALHATTYSLAGGLGVHASARTQRILPTVRHRSRPSARQIASTRRDGNSSEWICSSVLSPVGGDGTPNVARPPSMEHLSDPSRAPRYSVQRLICRVRGNWRHRMLGRAGTPRLRHSGWIVGGSEVGSKAVAGRRAPRLGTIGCLASSHASTTARCGSLLGNALTINGGAANRCYSDLKHLPGGRDSLKRLRRLRCRCAAPASITAAGLRAGAWRRSWRRGTSR